MYTRGSRFISISLLLLLLLYEKWRLLTLTAVCAGLWNQIFFLSNLALFILMPFAYFFTEAEGFSGSKKVSVMQPQPTGGCVE